MQARSMLAQRKARRLLMVPADTYPTPTITACSPSSASHFGGDTITATGSGFMSSWGLGLVKSVYCGLSLVTSFTIVSATQLTFVAPAHAVGVVAVVINTMGGCATKASGVTFT